MESVILNYTLIYNIYNMINYVKDLNHTTLNI